MIHVTTECMVKLLISPASYTSATADRLTSVRCVVVSTRHSGAAAAASRHGPGGAVRARGRDIPTAEGVCVWCRGTPHARSRWALQQRRRRRHPTERSHRTAYRRRRQQVAIFRGAACSRRASRSVCRTVRRPRGAITAPPHARRSCTNAHGPACTARGDRAAIAPLTACGSRAIMAR